MVCAICCLLLLQPPAPAAPPPAQPDDLFAGAKADGPVPDGLKRAYATFVATARRHTAQPADLQALCLPGAVEVTTGRRPRESFERGKDMNLPFLADPLNGLQPNAKLVEKLRDGCYRVSTGSTVIHFVQTKAGEWKIYHYYDRSDA